MLIFLCIYIYIYYESIESMQRRKNIFSKQRYVCIHTRYSSHAKTKRRCENNRCYWYYVSYLFTNIFSSMYLQEDEIFFYAMKWCIIFWEKRYFFILKNQLISILQKVTILSTHFFFNFRTITIIIIIEIRRNNTSTQNIYLYIFSCSCQSPAVKNCPSKQSHTSVTHRVLSPMHWSSMIQGWYIAVK